jgi:hypothetical protein
VLCFDDADKVTLLLLLIEVMLKVAGRNVPYTIKRSCWLDSCSWHLPQCDWKHSIAVHRIYHEASNGVSHGVSDNVDDDRRRSRKDKLLGHSQKV